MAADIYRKSNLEKLSSPEQLDRMVVVTPPMFWLAMLGAGIIIVAAIIWSFTAQLPVTVSCSGIYVDTSASGLPGDGDAVVCYVPLEDGKKIASGMRVLIYPSTVNQQQYGHMEATVSYVEDYVTSVPDIAVTLGNDSLVSYFTQSGPVVAVVCTLRADSSTASGYYWSSSKAAGITISEGTLVTADIVTETKAPITTVFPTLQPKPNSAG